MSIEIPRQPFNGPVMERRAAPLHRRLSKRGEALAVSLFAFVLGAALVIALAVSR